MQQTRLKYKNKNNNTERKRIKEEKSIFKQRGKCLETF